MNDLLLEPLKYYEQEGRERHKQNVSAFFEELKARSGVDVLQNKKTVETYNAMLAQIQKAEKKLSFKKFLRVLLFILVGVGLCMAIFGIVLGSVALIPIGIVLTALPLVVVFAFLNKNIKQFSENLDKQKQEAKAQLDIAWQQMAPLNSLFGDRDAIDLVEKTIPELDFDECYSAERERELKETCGYSPEFDENRSVLDTLSGTYKGNPFLFERHLIHKLGEETYHGSLTIRWTETYRDGKGNLSTRTRTQTLHASVVKPKPFYNEDTVLKYFSQGAPDLSFTREGLYHDNKSDKQIEKLVKKGEKNLKKKSEQALKDGGSFTEMANTEFEVLFDALDRDHEVQFRMMFTPLAQNNMVDLMRSDVGYGDDFDFYKSKRMTTIHSDHAQGWKMDASVNHYRSYDFEQIQKNFQSFNEQYFKSVFFDFAPLLAVPMYQEKPTKSLEPLKEYKVNYTVNEYETLANRMDGKLFLAEKSGTRAILKAHAESRENDTDRVEITAFSYRTFHRTDFVPVFGGDGRLHQVPVPWIEYIPVQKISHINVTKQAEKSDTSGTQVRYHGLFAKYFDK